MRVKIYQINQNRDKKHVKFEGFDRLEKYQGTKEVDSSIYDEVFNNELETDDLEQMFEVFNQDNGHPLMRGHSLSVSDVVVKDDGAYFCDRVGFKKIDFDESKTQKPNNLIRVVFVEPDKLPVVAEIENTLEAKQRVVGGKIECIYNGDNTDIVCNDEGKLESLEPNRVLGDSDVIAGNFLIVGVKGSEYRSLTEAEQNKYLEKYGEDSIEETGRFIAKALLGLC